MCFALHFAKVTKGLYSFYRQTKCMIDSPCTLQVFFEKLCQKSKSYVHNEVEVTFSFVKQCVAEQYGVSRKKLARKRPLQKTGQRYDFFAHLTDFRLRNH